MGFILNIDDLFHHIFPKEVLKNQDELNDSGDMVFSHDHNTTMRVLKRLFRKKNICSPRMWFNTIINLLINFWVFVLMNFISIFFNYFGGIAAALL